jgi:molecular chaperone DnaK (HSP70)
LHAGLILARSQKQPPRFSVRNVNSHSLGVVGTDPKTGRKRVAIIIPRNTPLPVTAQRVFRTQQTGQPSILVPIVEGESPSADACTAIGECVIDKLPPQLPAQTPVLVRFQYAANGRLTIGVKVGEHGQEVIQEINRVNGLSPEHLEAWRQWVSQGLG